MVKGIPCYQASTVRMAVWQAMADLYPLLRRIACRLMSMHASSCSTDRIWSRMGNLCRDNRRNLQLSKVDICSESNCFSKPFGMLQLDSHLPGLHAPLWANLHTVHHP